MPAAIRLPPEPSPLWQSLAKLKRVRGFKDAMKWSLASFRLAGLPLRIRPAFILFTFLCLLVLSLLGFHPTLASHIARPEVPFSDKILHFVCFLAATMLFYHIFVVEEAARRVPGWRWFNELASVGVCVLCGGILSEFIQSLLPYKTFQFGDVIANLLGSSLGVVLSHRLTAQRRRDRELRRLYEQLGEMSDSDDEDGDGAEEGLMQAGAEEREMEEGRVRAEGRLARTNSGAGAGDATGRGRRARGHDPWNASVGDEEIFGLGDDDEDDSPAVEGRKGGRAGPL